MATFPTITYAPVVGASRKQEARVLKAQFGDGYAQRASDGINNVVATYDLTWEDISRDDAKTLDDFLTARGGYESFDWTPPGEASPKKWTCAQWSVDHRNPVLDTVTATFVQCFDLV